MTKALIWTRSQDDEAQDRPLLQAVPIPVIPLPCIELAWLDHPALPEKPCTALAITSPRAVDGMARDPRLHALLSKVTVHAFGAETTKRLMKLGARVQRHDVTSGRALGDVLTRLLPPKACLWIPGAREPAFDLVQHLAAARLEAHAIPLYATRSVTPDVKNLMDQLRRHDQLIVCFASPSAVEGFAPLLVTLPTTVLDSIKPCAIGETTARRARAHFANVAQAEKPELPALIEKALTL